MIMGLLNIIQYLADGYLNYNGHEPFKKSGQERAVWQGRQQSACYQNQSCCDSKWLAYVSFAIWIYQCLKESTNDQNYNYI